MSLLYLMIADLHSLEVGPLASIYDLLHSGIPLWRAHLVTIRLEYEQARLGRPIDSLCIRFPVLEGWFDGSLNGAGW